MSLLRSVSRRLLPYASGSPAASRSFALAADVREKLDAMVQKDKVVVFMKGEAEAPRCGFSNAVVQVLKMHAVPFQAYDVLSDERLRQAIKEYSSWPTIPQVYVDGQFIGGCDIILQMHRSSDLIETLKQAGIRSALAETK